MPLPHVTTPSDEGYIYFLDGVPVSEQTYTYDNPQASFTLTNTGTRNLIWSVGPYTDITVLPGTSETRTMPTDGVSSFRLRAQYGYQSFSMRSEEITISVPTVQSLSSQLAESTKQIFWIKNPPAPLVGCKCDGVTDDSVAFQNLNDYLAVNGGGTLKLPRSTNEITLLNQEINLNSNVDIEGYGWNSKIKCTAGASGNGNNILKAFEKANIRLSKFYIENMGFGKSGAWTPAGTFDGVGACILAVGSDNVVVDQVMAIKGSGYNGNEGVANIYYSCCTNSKIINNYVSICDNGICVDSWYNQYTGKSAFINDGVVISGNTITNGGGRGIVIENRSDTLQKGSIAVTGNTINKMAYAGIQGNNIFNCVITGNTIDGDVTGRSYGNAADNMWYGMEFVSGSRQAVISNNTIRNCKINGIRVFEARNLTVSANNIKNCLDYAVFIKNVNDDMNNVKVDGNNIDTASHGIYLGKDYTATVNVISNSCLNNTVKFNTVGGSTIGIDFQNHALSKCDGNIVTPVTTYGSSIGIKGTNSVKSTFNSNVLNGLTNGIYLINDIDSVSDSNVIEACSSAYKLDGCQRTSINSKIRGGTNVFEMLNGKTTESTKCRAFNCDVDGTTNIKTGNGLLYWGTGSAAPGTGTWDTGDRWRNVTPTVGSYSEWLYVSGAWKPIGSAIA